MTSPAGRARRSSRCRSSKPTVRCARCRSTWRSCARERSGRAAVRMGRAPCARRSARVARPPRPLLRAYERRPLAPLRRLALRQGRALDRAPSGGRRLVGRHPAAVGLLADGAAAARLPARASRDRARPGGPRALHGRGSRRLAAGWVRRPARAGAWKRASRPVWDTALSMVALSDAGLAEDHPAMVAAAEWLLGEEVTPTRRLVGAQRPGSSRGAGRSSSPTSTTRTSTTPPRSCWRWRA